jgi:hypothetical protein
MYLQTVPRQLIHVKSPSQEKGGRPVEKTQEK